MRREGGATPLAWLEEPKTRLARILEVPMGDILLLLDAHLDASHEAQDLPAHLHYSSDLDPGACERQIYMRRFKYPKRPPSLSDRLLWEDGRRRGVLVAESYRRAGQLFKTEMDIRSLRPSAWAWAGRLDVLTTEPKLIEVKSRSAGAFEAARSLPYSIVKEAHRWQSSAYLYFVREFYAKPSIPASLLYLPRDSGKDGTYATPIEVDLESSGLLIPLPKLIEQEIYRSRLLYMTAPPPIIERKRTIRFWKNSPRKVWTGYTDEPYPHAASSSLPWNCRFCEFRNVSCHPGENDMPFVPAKHELTSARTDAEVRWSNGETSAPLVVEIASPAPARPDTPLPEEFLRPLGPAQPPEKVTA